MRRLSWRPIINDEAVEWRHLQVNHPADVVHPETLDEFWRMRQEQGNFIFLGADGFSQHVRGLRHQIGSLLGRRTTASYYVSDSGRPILGKHYDTQDVLWVQADGERGVAVGPDDVETWLMPGDGMVIPRGILHTALPQLDAPSGHLCIGIGEERSLQEALEGIDPAMTHAAVGFVIEHSVPQDEQLNPPPHIAGNGQKPPTYLRYSDRNGVEYHPCLQ